MLRLTLTVAAAAAFVAAGSLMQEAKAVTLGHPGALDAAIDEGNVVDQVHCIPGYPHHYYPPYDGCYYGGYYGPGFYGPGYWWGPRFRGGGFYRFGGGGYRFGGGGFRGGGFRFGGGGFRGGFRGGFGGRGGGFGGRGGGRRSDIRLKHDIVRLGELDNGLGFYRFSYNGSDKAYVGVMAQEVQTVMPEAVTRGRDGYLRVYYDRVGVPFETYEQWLKDGAVIPTTRH
jgi:hypothetical protein